MMVVVVVDVVDPRVAHPDLRVVDERPAGDNGYVIHRCH